MPGEHRHRPKIGYSRAPATDAVLDHGDRNFHALGPGPELEAEWTAAGLTLPDRPAMRRYRIDRVRQQLRRHDCDAALLCDPINIRYATDTTNMSLWTAHNAVRYTFVATDGPAIQFEFSKGEFLDTHSEVVDEIRPGQALTHMFLGGRQAEAAARWAAEIHDLVKEHGRGTLRLAVDHVELEGARALEALGIELVGGMALLEQARLIKSTDEIHAMRCAAHACMAAIDDMRATFEPGVTEMALWARLQEGNFRRYGEWIETRLLSSGPRTNPWYQEASSRVVEAGDLMGFDTDLVGAYGACIDMSRTWLCGGGSPNAEQASTFELAIEQITRNMELFRVGATFRELTDNAWYPSREDYHSYTVLAHGTGLCDEYPSIYTREEWDTTGNDGVIEAGMVMSVESFVGPVRGREGVKLEQQILITEDGIDLLTPYSMDLE